MTLVPILGGASNPRLSQTVIRVPTSFANSLADITVESRLAIVYADGNVEAIVRGERTFKAGTYTNLTVDPISDTKVKGPPLASVATRILRYVALEDHVPVPMLMLKTNTFREEWAENMPALSTRTVVLDPENSYRWAAVNYTIELSTDGVVFGTPVASTYLDQYMSFNVPPGRYKAARFSFVTPTKFYQSQNQDIHHEYVELDRVVFDPPGVGADFLVTPNDQMPYMDGFLVGVGREVATTPGDLWYPLEPEFAGLREPVFLVIRGMIEADVEDVTCRFEITVGREETGPLGAKRYWHVAQAQWFRNAQKANNCGTFFTDFILGIDIFEPVTHVRVRNVYPPFVQAQEHGRLTLHAFAVPFSALCGRSIKSYDTLGTHRGGVQQ